MRLLVLVGAWLTVAVALAACAPEQPGTRVTPTERTAADDGLTTAQQNAVESAQDYLSISGFSQSGLVKQLEFEGFSPERASSKERRSVLGDLLFFPLCTGRPVGV